jgi:hypothetical protein
MVVSCGGLVVVVLMELQFSYGGFLVVFLWWFMIMVCTYVC